MSADICLVNMPYSSLTHPSLALGLIETYIKAYNHQVDVIYANLEFAHAIGLAEYDLIDHSYFEHLIGEWTFSQAAFSDKANTDEQFFALFSDITDEQKYQLCCIRDHAHSFIDTLTKRILAANVKIVACTSTFQQNCASLALLRQLKAKDNSIITMMGGANCESIMGQTISESFPWVDYVFSGECDAVIGEFVDKLIRDKTIDIHNLPHGFIAQGHGKLLITQATNNNQPPRGYIEDMQQVGTPIYDSYFSTIHTLGLTNKIATGLLAETSRGCWWGAKKHCTFCGLNGVSMAHRCKPTEQVLAEFKQLSTTYNNTKFEIVDNILPMEYMTSLLPELSKDSAYHIFYETKSNLKKSHIEQLADAGIKWIQPGFESLHDDFLKLIDKGVTGIQNVSALKWCRNYGINVTWNLLCAAPNEQTQWYDEMSEILPLLSHLQPPYKKLIPIRFPRFSPYFKQPEKYGLNLAPLKSYQYIYPLDEPALANIAYFFDHQSNVEKNIFALNEHQNFTLKSHQNLQKALDRWIEHWAHANTPFLYMSDQGEHIVIIDSRKVATNFTHQLTGLSAEIYRLCQEPITLNRLEAKLKSNFSDLDDNKLNQSLTDLINNKLLLSLSGCYLSLALVGKTPALPTLKENPAGYLNLNG
ncbi:RiPP maturation radical SAM C-methyltransferase [Thalassotalea sp. G2M2-11]|uniref:RiPP maturation radical SAM C-methyltransferase n=1 Tax=Thalassotalea sp. G2M2-11 TaxID=2787627 RepID=UPI0019D306F7|nr:RiPP maturation radical SAM C-methyltransferase [Thalassotalea sp. G2M2-11]